MRQVLPPRPVPADITGSTCCPQLLCHPHSVVSLSHAVGVLPGAQIHPPVPLVPTGVSALASSLPSGSGSPPKAAPAGGENVGNMPPSSLPPHLWMGLRLLLPSTLPLQPFNNWDAAACELSLARKSGAAALHHQPIYHTLCPV